MEPVKRGDIVEGVVRVTANTAKTNEAWDSDNPDPATSQAPYRYIILVIIHQSNYWTI